MTFVALMFNFKMCNQ